MATSSTYAPPVPGFSGTTITVDYLLNNPIIVWRLLRTIVQQRLVGNKLLTGRVDMTGSGAAVFETSEPIFVDQAPDIIDQLADYPFVTSGGATANLATTIKRGFASLISDEDVARNRLDVVNRKLLKMANYLVFTYDSVILSAIASAVTQTQGAAAAWNTTGADQLLDLLLSSAQVDTLNQGYLTDTVVAKPVPWARLVASISKTFGGAYSNPDAIRTGSIVEIAGLTLLKSTNLPSGTDVMVADSTMLGSIGYEALAGGYIGDPADPLDVESKLWHVDEKDAWQIQTRKVGVPMIQEPGAAVKVTGV